MWAKISCGQMVGKTKSEEPANPHKIRVLDWNICDEARHGRGLEGLLNRYFK